MKEIPVLAISINSEILYCPFYWGDIFRFLVTDIEINSEFVFLHVQRLESVGSDVLSFHLCETINCNMSNPFLKN
jgi:hypothetical protein